MSAPVLSSELQDFIGKLKCGSENIRDFDMMLASMCIEYREVMENELQDFSNYLQRCLRKIAKSHTETVKELTTVLEKHVAYAVAIPDGVRLGNDLNCFVRAMDGRVSDVHTFTCDACREFDKAMAFGMGDAYEVAARWEEKFYALYMAMRGSCEQIFDILQQLISVYSDIESQINNGFDI